MSFLHSPGQWNQIPYRLLGDSATLAAKAAIDSIPAVISHRLDSGIAALNTAIDSTYSLIMSPAEYHATASRLYDNFRTELLPDTSISPFAKEELNLRLSNLKAEVDAKKVLLDSLMAGNEFFDAGEVKRMLTLTETETYFERLSQQNSALVPSGQTILPPVNVINGIDLPSILPLADKLDISDELRKIRAVSGVSAPKALNQLKGSPAAGIQAAAEKALLNSAGGDDILQATRSAEDLQHDFKSSVELLKDTQASRINGNAIPKKYIDHLAGHEDKIQSEIQSLDKLQRKYHSVTDVRYLPKHRTNPEKGKPFVERVIIGTSFQIDRGSPWTTLDVSPYIGYRFSDRLRACLGGTYQMSVDTRTLEFSRLNKVYGYRTFVNHRIFGGWFGHLEFEMIKTPIPRYFAPRLNLKNPTEPTWVPMAYAGLFKTFSLGRRFQGQTQILYNFLAIARNFDFNQVSFRFGFEYKLKKSKRQQ